MTRPGAHLAAWIRQAAVVSLPCLMAAGAVGTRRPRKPAPAPSGPPHQEFRRDVEGLRAVAIVCVVLYHVRVPGLSGGYVGVDVFFVISGFLITGQLVRELEKNGRLSFLGFYARRARRILPAATLVTMVTVVVSALVLNPLATQRVQKDALSAVFFGANYHFAAQGADYFNADLPPSPVQHYWSLSVEEQFYIVWPLVLAISSVVWLGARAKVVRTGPLDADRLHPDPRPARRTVIPTVAAVLGAVAVLSLLASILQTRSSPAWAYYSITTRAWELATGALVALFLPLASRLDRRLAMPLTWLGLTCIAIAAASFTDSTPFPGSDALLPVLGAAAVIVGGGPHRRGGAEALLGTPPFQRVGSWSYSWYLWHWPVLILGAALVGHSLSRPEGLAAAAISLAFAITSFVLVERPIRRIQLVMRRPALGVACAGALAASAIGVVALSGSLATPLVSTATAKPPTITAVSRAAAVATRTSSRAATTQASPALSELAADLANGVKTRRVPGNLNPSLINAANAKPVIVNNNCHLQHPETRSRPCVYGDTRSPVSIVLLGDSHAATWFPALNLISEQQHWRLVDLTKAGCPSAEVNIFFKGGTPYPQCTQWRRDAEAQIAALHPLLVITTWARYIEAPEATPLAGVARGYGSTWLDGVAASFDLLRRSADHVVFISDTPTFASLVPDCVAGHLSNVRPCTTSRRSATLLPGIKSQELRLARQERINWIDPTSWFCARSRCPVVVGNILLYRDVAHMTPAWSRFLTPVLADAILPIVRSQPAAASGG